MALSLKIEAHSEVGLVRSNNQDSAYISPSLIVVADGMGGAAAGDLASSVAIRELRRADAQKDLDGEEMLEVLGGALTKANDSLADLVAWDHSLEGMGTTVCGAMFDGDQYGICHIGDSRGYLVRDGEFKRLTRDHSWVQSLVDDGKITPEEAATHPHRSLLLKVLNGQPTHSPDFELMDAKLGDRLLFCSDGLCGMVEDDVIEPLLTSGDDLPTIVKELTRVAHEAGGLDNITIIVADVVEGDPALAAMAPQVLGAASTVEIPKVDAPAPIDLGDATEDTTRIRSGQVPQAPAPVQRSVQTPPPTAIDPDRYEQIRYTPQAPSRRRFWPIALALLLVVALVVGGVFAFRAYLATQFFIGPDDQRVAIYQGSSDDLFGDLLSEKVETSTIRIVDLPPFYADKVRARALEYDSLDQAHEQLKTLGEMAERCIAERAAQASPSPSTPASPTQTDTPDARPSGQAPSGSATPATGPAATRTPISPSAGSATSAPGTPASSASPRTPATTMTSPAAPRTSAPGTPSPSELEACG